MNVLEHGYRQTKRLENDIWNIMAYKRGAHHDYSREDQGSGLGESSQDPENQIIDADEDIGHKIYDIDEEHYHGQQNQMLSSFYNKN